MKNSQNIVDKREIQNWTNEAHIGRKLFEEENHIKNYTFLEDDVFGDSECTNDDAGDDDVGDI
ncbi:hypothetical protein HOY80DRAFT_1052481 [Tuber brumale]|nr:hypothetical protein HOY80DRAFT_1052481 [Tuber brumale]